jgi:hypothetical protein
MKELIACSMITNKIKFDYNLHLDDFGLSIICLFLAYSWAYQFLGKNASVTP